VSGEFLFVRIGRRSRTETFPVTARLASGREARGTFVHEPGPLRSLGAVGDFERISVETGRLLSAALFRGEVLDLVGSAPLPIYGSHVRVELFSAELFSLP
jgi:hypothetical protein